MAGSRDWAGLADGPAGLIADRVLAYDVADYVRLRAVCSSWRRCSSDPRTHGVLDRRFHPRRWTMLREKHATPNRRSFLNTSTGECVQVDIPELRDHGMLTVTAEGLLVLLHEGDHVRLLNPLTRQLLTDLPPVTSLLSPQDDLPILCALNGLTVSGLGIARDDSTVVLCFNRFRTFGIAKPGDDHWTSVSYHDDSWDVEPIMFAGRFYCVDQGALMVLEMSPPRLEVAAELHMLVRVERETMRLVDNGGVLMLVHRMLSGPLCYARPSYDLYKVDLDRGTLFLVNSLGGGRALFIGFRRSLSVPIKVFPSGSIAGDTIYLDGYKVEAYHLADRSITPASSSIRDGLVTQPLTLVECLAYSCTY